jgi:hypothetical protein
LRKALKKIRTVPGPIDSDPLTHWQFDYCVRVASAALKDNGDG